MKKVGVTSSGSILVEMTLPQYEALVQVVTPDLPNEAPLRDNIHVRHPHAMAVKRKLQSVRSCIVKLKPKNSEEVFRLIKSVYHQAGGISDTEVSQILSVLEKERFLGFNEDGTVNYVGGLISRKEDSENGQGVNSERKPLISA